MKRHLALLLIVATFFTAQDMRRRPMPPPSASDFVSDTFTEAASETVVSDHTGEVGASYTKNPHANYAGSFMKVDGSTDKVFGEGTSAYYASGVPPDADYRVCGDFHHVTTIAVNVGVVGRMDITTDTMYLARFNDGTTWQLRKIVAAVSTTLGSSTTNVPSAGSFKNGCLYMIGDQIRFDVEGSTVIGPITDNAITAAGRAGIRSAGASSATTGMHIDNLTARDQ